MPSGNTVELMGANQGSLRITGSEARTSIQLDPGIRRKVTASLTEAATADETTPERVFLNLENVRGRLDSTVFQVYLGLPEDATPTDHPEQRAGSIALFGVRKASLTHGEHAGQGLTFVLEITNIINALHLTHALDIDTLDVRLVPLKPVPENAQVSIGRVSIFRQGH